MKLKVFEIFKSIQGEGIDTGLPMVFVRLAGCNRKCWFCDTKYSWENGSFIEVEELSSQILKMGLDRICWTGGEPLLQSKGISEVIEKIKEISPNKCLSHYLETNGDQINKETLSFLNLFQRVVVSPKDYQTAKRVRELLIELPRHFWEIKVLWINGSESELEFATVVMPITTGDRERDKETAIRCVKWCIENNKRFSPRVSVWLGIK